MSFRRVFPATTWFLRQPASRPVRRVYISVLAALLIPAVALRIEQDRLEIMRAALERLNGPNQCPPRILPRRARDAEHILLVEVQNVGPTITEAGGYMYRRASFRSLRVLKGKPQRTPEDIRIYRESYWGEVPVHNPTYDLLSPGQRLILFPEANTCKEMDGSDGDVRIIETTLGPRR
jgi:hypothetical protein